MLAPRGQLLRRLGRPGAEQGAVPMERSIERPIEHSTRRSIECSMERSIECSIECLPARAPPGMQLRVRLSQIALLCMCTCGPSIAATCDRSLHAAHRAKHYNQPCVRPCMRRNALGTACSPACGPGHKAGGDRGPAAAPNIWAITI